MSAELLIDRMELDGVGSPSGLAARIHELLPDLPIPVPVEELCRQLDIVSIEAIHTGGFEAALITDANKASGAIVHAAGRHLHRTRFSIAHELGHFLLPSHRPSSETGHQCSLDHIRTTDAKTADKRRRIEAEANLFAAHLLMPPSKVRKAILAGDNRLEGLVALADRFGVSKEAMAISWVREHREPVAVILAKDGRIARSYRGEEFPWIERSFGEPLPTGSTAFDAQLAPGQFSEIEEVEPDVWLSERDATKLLALDEQILGQSRGFQMILLVAELDEC